MTRTSHKAAENQILMSMPPSCFAANPAQTGTATTSPAETQATPSSAADAKRHGSHTTRCHPAAFRRKTSPRRTPRAPAACHRRSHALSPSHSDAGCGTDSPTTGRRCAPSSPRCLQAAVGFFRARFHRRGAERQRTLSLASAPISASSAPPPLCGKQNCPDGPTKSPPPNRETSPTHPAPRRPSATPPRHLPAAPHAHRR